MGMPYTHAVNVPRENLRDIYNDLTYRLLFSENLAPLFCVIQHSLPYHPVIRRKRIRRGGLEMSSFH